MEEQTDHDVTRLYGLTARRVGLSVCGVEGTLPVCNRPGNGGYVHTMLVYMFLSRTDSKVVGLTGSRTGDDLPAYLAPWTFCGSTFMPEGDPRHDAAVIRETVGRGGHCLAPVGFIP